MTMADNRQNGSILQNFFPTFNYQKDHGDFILYFHHLYHWLTLFWLIILSATNLTKFLFNYCNSSIKNLSNLGSGFGAVSWQKGRGFNLVIDLFRVFNFCYLLKSQKFCALFIISSIYKISFCLIVPQNQCLRPCSWVTLLVCYQFLPKLIYVQSRENKNQIQLSILSF